MAVVVVGGNSRNIGKTSVAAALIRALRDRDWIAVKITQYGHGICSRDGEKCQCAQDEHRVSITEERDRSGKKDTSRFLLAGARRAFWVRTRQGQLTLAMPELLRLFRAHPFVMVESNSLLEFIKPAIYLPVMKLDVEDFKPSARRMLTHADGIVAIESGNCARSRLDALPPEIPHFPVAPPDYVSDPLLEFVRRRL